MSDLAYTQSFGPTTDDQLIIGESPVVTGYAPALANVTQYQVLVLTATGLSTDFTGVTSGDKCVIAAQPGVSGASVPYFSAGTFNHALLGWPAAQDTFAKRRQFFMGTPITVGKLMN